MKVLLALVALWALSVPQNALAKERSFVLPNGLRVTLVEAPDASRAAILVNVAAGSADERSDQRGIAHLAEHVFARGFTSRIRTVLRWKALWRMCRTPFSRRFARATATAH